MTELFLSKEQVEQFNYDECQRHLKTLSKTYNLNKPLHECFAEVWPVLDELVNTILYIEDRIQKFQDPRILSMNPDEKIVKPEPKPRIKPGRPARQYRIGDKVYLDIHDASKKTGIKLQTLKTYVSRKPDRYGYVD